MKLYLIRHAQSIGNIGEKHNTAESNLTEVGYVQADRLGKYIATLPVDMIICSPHKRAKKTLEFILKYKEDIPYVFSEEIIETQKGVFKDMPKKDMERAIEESGKDSFTFRPEGGENFQDVCQRAQLFLEKFLDQCKEEKYEHVVLISHSGFISASILYLLNKPWQDGYYFGVKNTSISWFELNEEHKVLDFSISTMDHILK